MRSLLRASLAGLVLAAGVALPVRASAANVELPEWVPPDYAKFFVRRVETRPAWERALNTLDISVGDTGQSFALIAGISNYPKMSGRAGDLWPARLDVEKMAAYLAGEPESGMTASNGRGYLLTSEATSLEDRYNGISFATLRAQFQDIVDAGHQVLALINACYGVDFHKLSLAFGATDAPLPTREGAHAITAGGSGELTWSDQSFGEGDGPKGSIFFEGIFAALDGRADKLPADGIVTVGELETYLRTTVSRFTEEQQNPTGGDLISTRSPGGFFFLDRNRQIASGNATPLTGEWWGGVSFGAVPPPAPAAPTRQVASADAANGEMAQLVGRWEGEAVEPGGFRFPVELEITEGCAMNAPCGKIAVPHVPCRGDIALIDSRKGRYEFDVSNFDASSDKSVCQPGAGEVFAPLPDGTLRYTATYSGAEGILHRQ
jgi:hypothetical protein